MERKWQRPLTDEEMALVESKIEVGTYQEAWVAACITVYDIALQDLGSSWATFEGELTPWDYAIPQAQWERIGQLLIEKQGQSDVGRVNILLDWGNKGPSAYQPEVAS